MCCPQASRFPLLSRPPQLPDHKPRSVSVDIFQPVALTTTWTVHAVFWCSCIQKLMPLRQNGNALSEAQVAPLTWSWLFLSRRRVRKIKRPPNIEAGNYRPRSTFNAFWSAYYRLSVLTVRGPHISPLPYPIDAASYAYSCRLTTRPLLGHE